MKRCLLHAGLLFITLVGTCAAFNNASMLRKARRELSLATQLSGTIHIGEPSKICFVRFGGTKPGQFAWRFYMPPGIQAASWDDAARDVQHFIARVRFAYSDAGTFCVYTCFRNTWRSQEIGSVALAQFVRRHSTELIVEQAGDPYQQEVEPHVPHTLLRLRVPEHLLAEARVTLGEDAASRSLPVLFEWRIGGEE